MVSPSYVNDAFVHESASAALRRLRRIGRAARRNFVPKALAYRM
jgi:hypothetical protein